MHPLRVTFKRKRAFFMEGTLDLPAHTVYDIFKHLFLTKGHCGVTEACPIALLWNNLVGHIRPCVRPPAKDNCKLF